MVWLLLLFLSEFGAWTAITFLAYDVAGGGAMGWVAAASALVVTLVAWGRWASPKSRKGRPAGAMTKVLVFGLAIVGLYSAGQGFFGLLLLVACLVSHVGVLTLRR